MCDICDICDTCDIYEVCDIYVVWAICEIVSIASTLPPLAREGKEKERGADAPLGRPVSKYIKELVTRYIVGS